MADSTFEGTNPMMPNQDQVLSLVRSLIGIGSGYAIGHGYFTADQVTMFSGVAAAIVPLVWGMFAHTTDAKVASVEALGAQKIVFPLTASPEIKAIAADKDRPQVVLDSTFASQVSASMASKAAS